MEKLLQLYKSRFGHAPETTESLPKAGSNRHYVRLTCDGQSVIGVVSPDVRENRCFVYLSRHFAERGLPVPEIFAVSDDATCYLQTDLGQTSLYQALKRGREAGAQYDESERKLIAKTIRLLPHVQVTGAEAIDEAQLLPPTRFDEQAAMFDLNYFKYCFLKTADLAYDEVRFEKDLQTLAADLVKAAGCPANGQGQPLTTFLYRDFQARNVMLVDAKKPHFIDYQGGQVGPLQYDVASFLWQASARYPQTLREAMIEEYIEELRTLCDFDEEAFRSKLHLFVLFRIMQVLGAYGLRGYFERKQYFIDSIPPAIQNLRRQLLDGVCLPYPYLEEVLHQLVSLPKFNEVPAAPSNLPPKGEASGSKSKDISGKSEVSNHKSEVLSGAAAPAPAGGRAGEGAPLVVRVFSFSYKKGIPADESGNGGGYVFDCRAPHNPGRYEQYKHLTGLDAPVIKFLEDDGEILQFLDHIYPIADAHVARYIERGFTSLMFSFGCTGGQHRSVYSAQHLAEHIHQRFGVEVRLCHREQGISVTLPRKS